MSQSGSVDVSARRRLGPPVRMAGDTRYRALLAGSVFGVGSVLVLSVLALFMVMDSRSASDVAQIVELFVVQFAFLAAVYVVVFGLPVIVSFLSVTGLTSRAAPGLVVPAVIVGLSLSWAVAEAVVFVVFLDDVDPLLGHLNLYLPPFAALGAAIGSVTAVWVRAADDHGLRRALVAAPIALLCAVPAAAAVSYGLALGLS